MPSVKLATFNCEWMIALFGLVKDADWLADPKIPASFAGGYRGSIRFEPISDVHGLCRRIAGAIASHFEEDTTRPRHKRPSDHKPVSVVIEY